MSEAHKLAGSRGGQATFKNNGRCHMVAIGREGGLKGMGGRPSWQETLAKEEQRLKATK